MKAFEATELFFQQAANQLDLPNDVRELMLTPKREVQVQVPVALEDDCAFGAAVRSAVRGGRGLERLAAVRGWRIISPS